MPALLHKLAGALALGALALGGCSNDQVTCSAPGGGNFTLGLTYAKTIPVALSCSTGGADASTCGARAHAFDGTTWSIAVSGSMATVKTGTSTFACTAIGPRSSPQSLPDGASVPGTGCYLAIECGAQTVGDAGPAQVQIQLLPQGSTDVVAIVHDTGSDCCTDEYTGAWH